MGRPGPWRFYATLFIVAISILRVVYLVAWSPLDLATDEAHYWDWARHLDWSYYSKGPLVAWLMAFSGWCFQHILPTHLLGSPGWDVLAVRAPAVICGALFLEAVYRLTIKIHRDDRLAFLTMAVIAILPATTAGGILMTIDAPFVCLWAWALLLGHKALFEDSKAAWPVLGLLIGLGVLAKYTMLLWPLSAVLFCLATPGYRGVLLKPGLWVCAGVVALCCLPILVWNIQHDWVSLKHVAGQAGAVEQKSAIRWLGPLEYFATQIGVGVVIWSVVWLCGIWQNRPGRESRPQFLFLWWMSVPTFVLFWAVSARVSVPANWPIAGFVSGLILAAAWFDGRCRNSTAIRLLAIWGMITSVLASLAALDSRPLITPMAKVVGHDRVRRWDPTSRLRGWRWLAKQVQEIRTRVASEDGEDPILATDRWNIAGELAFYMPGHPQVLSVGRPTGDRFSQYDLWRPNPVDDAQVYFGRAFVLVGEPKDEYPDAFDRLEEPILLEYREHGELVAWWWVCVGRGYHGFPKSVKSGRH